MSIDKKVLELVEKVKQKQANLDKIKKPRWLTSCSYVLNGTRVNIQVCKDVYELALVRGDLLNLRETLKEASEAWELKISDHLAGFSINDWLSDLDLRVKVLSITSEEKKLKTLQKKLDGLLSPEQKRELELENILKELQD